MFSHSEDRRWVEAAQRLNQALAEAGGLALCAHEAEVIAAALPEAIGDAFGEAGLEWLRELLSNAGCWWSGPGTPTRPDAAEEWWSECGRWEPTASLLEGMELWEHAAAMVRGNVMRVEDLTAQQASLVFTELTQALQEIRAGARWDQARWDAAEARLDLDSLEQDPADPAIMRSLARLLEGGNLPPEMAEQAKQALARGAGNT